MRICSLWKNLFFFPEKHSLICKYLTQKMTANQNLKLIYPLPRVGPIFMIERYISCLVLCCMRKEKSFTLLNMVRTVSFLKFDRVVLKYPFDAINNCVLLHSMSLASSYHVSDNPCITIHTYLLPYIFRLYACPYQKVKKLLLTLE